MSPRGIGPMLAKLQPEIPRGEGWTYEPKWDGFRTIVTVGDDGVTLESRDDRPMSRYFPEVVSMLEGRRTGSLVADGELVMVRPAGLSFDELQLRLHPAASRVQKLAAEIPATLILFDLLAEGDDDLRRRPLAERRDRLQAVAERIGAEPTPERLGGLPAGPDLRVTPWTDVFEVAKRWFDDEAGLGQDGIVAKRTDQTYQPGVRGWVKVKHRSTADCVVGGYRLAKDGDGVGSLLLGLHDAEGRLHYVGHTSSFRVAERRAILEALGPLEGGGGFGEDARSPGGQSRWSAGREAAWVPLDPVLVCEVSFDRVQHGRFRHAATFVRWRDDRTPASCTFDQVGASPPSWG
ncbi:MAG: ATP-dependent DNA ligase [Actinomycetota bacterium]